MPPTRSVSAYDIVEVRGTESRRGKREEGEKERARKNTRVEKNC
jgi:hypothetical protein